MIWMTECLKKINNQMNNKLCGALKCKTMTYILISVLNTNLSYEAGKPIILVAFECPNRKNAQIIILVKYQ